MEKPVSGHDKKIVLQIKKLHKAFGDQKVLNGFNLVLYEGENLVLMGKSGSRKICYDKMPCRTYGTGPGQH